LCTAGLRATWYIFGLLEKKWSQNERFWPEAKGRIHIDAWREVSVVDNFCIYKEAVENADLNHLFSSTWAVIRKMNLKSTIIKSSPLHKVWDWHPKGQESTFYNTAVRELAYRISTTNTGSMWWPL
jgi:hypothetical protein